MHENEFEIDKSLVQTLIENQCPQWAQLPLTALKTSGTDHALYRLGKDYLVRLPRLDGAKENIDKECEWLPKLALHLKTPVSEPVFKGHPTNPYPSFWTITKWNESYDPSFEKENEYRLLAKDLAQFLNDLQNINLPGGPLSRRGIPLRTKELDEETRAALNQLKDEPHVPVISNLWDHFLTLPTWNKEPVWVHGDLLPGNILIRDNRLSAVIDFSSMGMGDPACDLIIAWSLFNSDSRRVFREALKNIDNDTWQRGKGWALSIAVIILPYYRNTNPTLVSVAKRMIEQVLSESKGQ